MKCSRSLEQSGDYHSVCRFAGYTYYVYLCLPWRTILGRAGPQQRDKAYLAVLLLFLSVNPV